MGPNVCYITDIIQSIIILIIMTNLIANRVTLAMSVVLSQERHNVDKIMTGHKPLVSTLSPTLFLYSLKKGGDIMPTTLRPLPGVRIVVKGSRHHKSCRVGTEDIFYKKESYWK